MPMQSVKQAVEKGEAQASTKIFREFKGVNTKADRTAIPEDAFYDLQNLMPIGHANLASVPDISASLVDYGADSIYRAAYANINSTDYLISFATNGKVFAYDIAANTSAQINAGHLLSGSGSKMDQWKNNYVLFADSTGFYSWDGTTFSAAITGGILPGGTLTAPDIAVFSGRVWLYSNRVLYISELDDFSGATGWDLAGGALIQNLTDPQLRGQVTRMLSANGYLYLFGKSSILVISDVYIPTGASPPAPVFNILPVQSLVGSDQPMSVFTLDRQLMFANTYGLWNLQGVTATRASEDIDGTFKYLDTTFAISGGVAQVFNILNNAFLIKQANDPTFGTRVMVAMLFDKKWWFYNVSQSLTYIAGAIKSNRPTLFGFIGNKLYQLFGSTLSPATSFKTALWAMEDSLSDKEVQKTGFELTSQGLAGSFTMTMDSPNVSTTLNPVSDNQSVLWSNNNSVIVSWKNNSNSLVQWYQGGYLLFVADGLGSYSKYVGTTVGSMAGTPFAISSTAMDYILRRRW